MSDLSGRGDVVLNSEKIEVAPGLNWTIIASLPILFLTVVTIWIYPDSSTDFSNIKVRLTEFAFFLITAMLIVKYLSSRNPNLQKDMSTVTAVPVERIDVSDGVSVAVQTDNKNLNGEADILKNQHEERMKGMRRELREMKNRFSQKVTKARELAEERSSILSKLQLRIPSLERERFTLTAEKDAIEKQLDEEKRRNDDLMAKFQRVHQQLMQNGVITCQQGRAYFC